MVSSALVKVRGRNKYTGRWLYGNYQIEPANRKHPSMALATMDLDDTTGRIKSCLDVQTVEEETVGMYTGFNDRDDYEIYDGDFIRFGDTLGLVEQDPLEGVFQVIPMPMVAVEYRKTLEELDFSEVEVVGNFWDNQDLLEGV